MPLSALYKDVILEHNRNPRHFGQLPRATHAAEILNPTCGDWLRFELRAEGKATIAELAFSGEACAIAVATASLLGEAMLGKTQADFGMIADVFGAMLKSAQSEQKLALIGQLAALAELRNFPARHPCALLPFNTVAKALKIGAVAEQAENAGI